MAKVKIQGHASGTGILTVTAPDTDENRTITLPDETATLSTFDPDGAVTINDTGADVDFRVESDTKTQALFVQGSDGYVGINNGAPSVALEIYGDSGGDEMALKYSGTTGEHASKYLFKDFRGQSNAGIYNNLRNDAEGAAAGYLEFYTATGGTMAKHLSITDDGRGLSQFTAKAWVNFNGENTLAVRDSHNVSSVTDNGTGTYQVNIDVNMANVNYAVTTAAMDRHNNYNAHTSIDTQAVGSFPITYFEGSTPALSNTERIMAVVFGD